MIMIDRNKLPVEEEESVTFIQNGLMALRLNVDDFAASLDLFLYAHSRKMSGAVGYDIKRMVSWIKLAGTNGAIAAASFVATMHYIASLGGPAIRDKWNVSEYKAAKELIKMSMPGIKGVRASAAHPGEWLANAAETAKHQLRRPAFAPGGSQFGPGATVINGMHATNDSLNFSVTYAGQLETYELSPESETVLRAALEHFEAAFEPISLR